MHSVKTESRGITATELRIFLCSPVNPCRETETALAARVPGAKTFLGVSGRKMEIKAVGSPFGN